MSRFSSARPGAAGTGVTEQFDLIQAQRKRLSVVFSLPDESEASETSLLSDDLITDDSHQKSLPWKVLIVDRDSHDIIATLFSVERLHSLGITLHLLINQPRQRIPGIKVVYLVQSSDRNLNYIIDDISNNLYDLVYLNFSNGITRLKLESLVSSLKSRLSLKPATIPRIPIQKITDHFISFIALNRRLFSLNIDQSYFSLYSKSSSEDQLKSITQRIIDGLFSICVCMEKIPLIRGQKGGPSEMIAIQLAVKLAKHCLNRGHLFESCLVSPWENRPLLLILDRSIDFALPMHHSPIYWSMLNDLMKSRHCQFTCDGKPVTVDDTSDDFWMHNSLKPFPTVHESHSKLLNWYTQETERVGSASSLTTTSGGPASGATTKAALKSMPKYIKRKREIDKHSAFLNSIGESVKSRAIFDYFHCEDSLIHKGSMDKEARETMASLMDSGSRGTLLDKVRLLLIYYLCRQDLNLDTLAAFQRALIDATAAGLTGGAGDETSSLLSASSSSSDGGGGSRNITDWLVSDSGSELSAVQYLNSHKQLLALSQGLAVDGFNDSSGADDRGKSSSSLTDESTGLWQSLSKKLTSGLKEMLPMSGKCTLTRIVERAMSPDSLSHSVSSALSSHASKKHLFDFDKNYLTFDPQLLRAMLSDKSIASRVNSIFDRCDPREIDRLQREFDSSALESVQNEKRSNAFVFIAGGGSLAEFSNLIDSANRYSWNVIYGSTEILKPDEFVQQISKLGKE